MLASFVSEGVNAKQPPRDRVPAQGRAPGAGNNVQHSFEDKEQRWRHCLPKGAEGVGHTPTSGSPEQVVQLSIRVFLKMQATSDGVEVDRNIVRPADPTGRHAMINGVVFQRSLDVGQLLKCIFRMQMLHQLIAVRHVDTFGWNWNAASVREDEREVLRCPVELQEYRRRRSHSRDEPVG